MNDFDSVIITDCQIVEYLRSGHDKRTTRLKRMSAIDADGIADAV